MPNMDLLVLRDVVANGAAVCLKPHRVDALTPNLVIEMRRVQDLLAERYMTNPWEGLYYLVWYLDKAKPVGKMGIDYNYVNDCMRDAKERSLQDYLEKLFDLLYLNYIGLGLPVVNCSLVDRTVGGITREFFYLNRLNFVRVSKCSLIQPNSIMRVDNQEIVNNSKFPKFVYDRNQYYQYQHFALKSFHDAISDANIEPFAEADIYEIRKVFDDICQETLQELINSYAVKPKLLERLARQQTQALQ